MITRTLTTLAAVLVLQSGNVFSQQPTVFSKSRVKPTEAVVLKLTGELAREYAQISGSMDADERLDGCNISTTAVIAQRLKNDQVRIEHIAQVSREGRPDRLVTLTATVDTTAMRSLVRTVFEGDFTFSDATTAKESCESPTVIARHLSIPFISLADLEGVKLQSWTLESTIGE